ncbi:MAG: small ribosomal subunit Rsm22 family protein [Desulfovibrio sp.]|jgi:hypothetical protein|nr:small ribosomal subunit Rsm22 family protein [Desulfovibrio sp.]
MSALPEKKELPPRNPLSLPPLHLAEDLQKVMEATEKIFPVPRARRSDLPPSIRDLSRLLTRERAALARPYWAWSRFCAAYLYYFLPWNIYRLSRLLPGLDLKLRPGTRILDLGSGPLTLPLALWCARRETREIPLEFICCDKSKLPLELGAGILQEITGTASPWSIHLRHTPRELFPPVEAREKPHLITAINVLNESSWKSGTERDKNLRAALGEATKKASLLLAPGGGFFVLEPGTRLGGKTLALLRKEAAGKGFRPLSPCTHAAPCPFLNPKGARGSAAQKRPETEQNTPERVRGGPSGWCHFISTVGDLPPELARISTLAGLEKKRLSLSFLHLERMQDGQRVDGQTPSRERQGGENISRQLQIGKSPGLTPLSENAALEARVISDPIRLPDFRGSARYACSRTGLVLLTDAERLPHGSLARVLPLRDARGRQAIDGKSGLPLCVASS